MLQYLSSPPAKSNYFFDMIMIKIKEKIFKLTRCKQLTFKNGKAKRMGDLGYAVQGKPVLSVKVAVLNLVKEGIYPIQTH